MLSKFSVKKPMTIFVSVIAVIIVGVVALTSMTPDLLPNINLPYVIVMTTYPGASPEQVEEVVTKPLEQSLATIDKLSNISSQSSENFSLAILEFEEDANVDLVAVDIRDSIGMISGYWDDTVGTPTIMKINPNMMPVLVASVESDEMDIFELTDFINETLMNELEGTSGVASVSATGMIEQGVHVILNQDKIDAANANMQQAIADGFAETEQELADGKAEIQDGQSGIEEGKAALQDGQDQLVTGQAEAAAQLAAAEQQLQAQKDELLAAESALNAQIVVLDASIGLLQGVYDQLGDLYRVDQLTAELRALEQQKSDAETAKTALDTQIAAIESDTSLTTEEKQAQITAIETSPAYLENQTTLATIDSQITAKQAELTTAEAERQALMQQLAQLGITGTTIDEIEAQLQGLIADATTEKATAEQTLSMLQQGLIPLEDALLQLEISGSSATFQMSNTMAQLITQESALTSTEAQLDSALTELESAEEQLADAKQDAMDAANLSDMITMDMIVGILTAQDFSMPAGYVSATEDQQVLVRVGDELNDLDQLQSLMLMAPDIEGADPIYLADVADIVSIDNSGETYAKVNGNDSVMLSFSKQSNYATATASDEIRAQFDLLSEKYPGLHFTVMTDQGDYIYLIVNSVLQNLLWGGAFAIIVLLLFLRDWRPTLIIACSIPISLVFAIILMYFSGVTLNIISMSGLAVGVGMLVDNSVVVIENIYRLRSKGVPILKASVAGAAQVGGAITASTLTTVCVFMPIVFVQGITRELFTDMALTIGYALLASLIVALTLVPAMSSGMLKRRTTVQHKLFDKLVAVYEKSVRFALKHRVLVLVTAVVFMIVSVPISLARGFTFMPPMESAQVTATIRMHEDATLEETVEATETLITKLEDHEGIDSIGASISGSSAAMGGMSFSSGETDVTSMELYVILKEGYSSTQMATEIVAAGEGLAESVTASGATDMTSMMSGGGSGVTVQVYGNDLDVLQQAATQVATTMQSVDGIDTVNDGMEETVPELRITVDKNKAVEKGLTVAQVFQELAGAIANETSSISLEIGSVSADVVVIDQQAKDLTVEDIRNYEMTREKQDGTIETFKLSDIAVVSDTESLASIARDDQRRYLTVSGTLLPDYNISLVTTAVEEALASETLPEGISLEYTGENETIMEAMEQLLLMMALAVVLIYLIMVAQFQSLRSPFIVMFTIPLAFTGGLWGLIVTGMEVSVISMIGFVMLAGIIVNNGIVLVDYINQLRADGAVKKEAIVEAGKTRMRPILMTAVTTILGLSVMAIALGTGSEMMQPIAIVCIGGLIYATLMTLYVVPVIYDMFNSEKYRHISDADVDFVEEEEAQTQPTIAETTEAVSEDTEMPTEQ